MAAKNIRIFNCFTCRAPYKTLFASVSKSISGVLGNLPSFAYFRMQWPCDWWRHVTLKRVICIQIYLDANISKTNRDKCLVPKDHQYKTAYGESNAHMIDDVTWPWPFKVKVVTPICLAPIISKTAGHGYSGASIGNRHLGYQTVTCSMTSRNPKQSRSCPYIFGSKYWGVLEAEFLGNRWR